MDEDASPDGDYNNAHRALLQAFLARPSLTFEQAQPILAAIFTAQGHPTHPNDITPTTLAPLLSTLNHALSPYDLEIRSSRTQTPSRTPLYALVNTTSDALTALATVHSADEIAFVKRCIDDMFAGRGNTRREEVFAVGKTRAADLRRVRAAEWGVGGEGEDEGAVGRVQDVSMKDAERLLKSMVEEGWFEVSGRGGMYGLSTRALMELRGWLVEMYNEDEDEEEGQRAVQRVKFCGACKEIVTIGERCGDTLCGGRLHVGCTGAMWRAQGGRKKCYVCKRSWNDFLPVGAAAVGATVRRSAGRRSLGFEENGVEEEDADEGAEEDADEDAD